MKVALAQVNSYIGAFEHNWQKISHRIQEAREIGCDLVIFPELALLGYPPLDLLDRPDFVQKSRQYWSKLEAASAGLTVVCGVVDYNRYHAGKPYHNGALVCRDGEILGVAHKRLLPSYDVFDEQRYFEPGETVFSFVLSGCRIGVTICEDIWSDEPFLPSPFYHCDPLEELANAGCEWVVNISASPFYIHKSELVTKLCQKQAQKHGFGILYCNQVGGNDELIFQGHSLVVARDGQLMGQGQDFQEDLLVCDLDEAVLAPNLRGSAMSSEDSAQELLAALVLGLKDYAGKCGFQRFVVGLSGGIDSAVTASLAVLASGAGECRDKVFALALPGPFNAPESLEDAQALADNLRISFSTVAIDKLFAEARNSLDPVFANRPWDVTEENIQARLRGLILMAVSNKFHGLLLNTGNKSELAVGYCTLYGDMNGGLAVLGDVPKTMVYALAREINRKYGWIPERIMEKPPSAELRPDQKDEDSLPPYPVLDRILHYYVEEHLSVEEICKQGLEKSVVEWVVSKIMANEYKRRQAPPVLKVTSKAFGLGRRLPIAHGYR